MVKSSLQYQAIAIIHIISNAITLNQYLEFAKFPRTCLLLRIAIIICKHNFLLTIIFIIIRIKIEQLAISIQAESKE